jgi:enediyne biosynthesis protein E4
MKLLLAWAVLAGCVPPPDADPEATPTPTPTDSPLVEVVALRAPVHTPSAPLFVEQNSPFEGHTTQPMIDPGDRWLDDFTGGFAIVDCDVDGDLDVLFSDPTDGNRLLINDGTGGFTGGPDVAFAGDATSSASVADFDNDGDSDVLILNQFQANRLLVNDGACGFTDEAAARGIIDEHRSTHAVWGDLDGDGWLDLYLTNFAARIPVDAPNEPPPPHPDRLWLSDGAGSFIDHTDTLPEDTSLAFGMATALLDVDWDGDLDLLQTNDKGSHIVANRAWRNEGVVDGVVQWSNATDELAFILTPDGMGLVVGDIDGNGEADVVNTGNFEALFLNQGGLFVEAGLASGLMPMNPSTASWGGSLFDPDADGDLDLLYVESLFFDGSLDDLSVYEGPAWFFRNDWSATQQLIHEPDVGLDPPDTWRASATRDFDGDGVEDVVTTAASGASRLFLTNPSGVRGVVQIRLRGTTSPRDGRGAIVTLQRGDRNQRAWPGSADPYSTGSEPWVTFGMGEDDDAGPLEVRWPSGEVQIVESIRAGTTVIITEP